MRLEWIAERLSLSYMRINIFIAVLAVIAIALGIFIVQKEVIPKKASLLSSQPQSTKSDNESTDGVDVLFIPRPEATDQERLAYEKIVAASEKESAVVTLTQCVSDPLALRAMLGTTFIIENKDPVEHILKHSLMGTIRIPAHGRVEVGPQFSRVGYYGYTCDDSRHVDGIFHMLSR